MAYLFNKVLLYFLIAGYSLTAVVHSCYSAENIAKGKPYTLSPLPNYPLSAPPTDRTALTDGKYTVGRFWIHKTTVGWADIKTVEIMIDLEQVSTIGAITFNTARGVDAGVHYPKRIAAFIGPDEKHLMYVGDIADDPGNNDGSYRTKRFSLKGIDVKGRYVLLVVQPNGSYLFCDEIEVSKDDRGLFKSQGGFLTKDAALNLFDQIKWFDPYKQLLNGLIKKTTSENDDKSTYANRLESIRQRIATFQSTENVESTKTDILKLRNEILRKQIPAKRFYIEAVNPFISLSPAPIPSGVPEQRLSFAMPQGGYDHASFVLTNVTDVKQKISVAFDLYTDDAFVVSLFQVPFIKSGAYEYVADPLLPAKGIIELGPSESMLLFMTVQGKHPGTWQGSLKLTEREMNIDLPVKINVVNFALPNNLSLNSVNWAYLEFPLISNRKADAVKDLLAHHTNVIVVSSKYLPIPETAFDPYFMQLEKYLKLHQGASKILLFADFGSKSRATVNGKYPFMGIEWKSWFLKWYKKVMKAADRAGFPGDQIYMYPFDEMKDKDIEMFISFSKWAKKEIPGIKLYATLNTYKALSAIPYLDIAQIVDRDYIMPYVPVTGKDLWLYDANGPAKSLSSYTYYRLMSWKAFLRNYKGVGFWAYADAGWEGNPGTAWDDFKGEYPAFSVIYEGPDNTIISSRRWEAWRMGIEDYELLTMYAKAKGDKAAKDLAASVLNHPEDTSRADEVRRKILTELSGMENN